MHITATVILKLYLVGVENRILEKETYTEEIRMNMTSFKAWTLLGAAVHLGLGPVI